MTPYTVHQTRPRIAGFGLAAVMTMMVMTGIDTLAETQAPHPEAAYAAATVPQVVVVVGQSGAGG